MAKKTFNKALVKLLNERCIDAIDNMNNYMKKEIDFSASDIDIDEIISSFKDKKNDNKKTLTTYQKYMRAEMMELRKSQDDKSKDNKENFGIIAKKWKTLNDDEKLKYNNLEDLLKDNKTSSNVKKDRKSTAYIKFKKDRSEKLKKTDNNLTGKERINKINEEWKSLNKKVS